ncbi:MAG: ABC transporter ATP-binding protein [Chloroflexota bacterium]|nr:ABC transporter ATP-binding protein [Chloroflexota bacterium]
MTEPATASATDVQLPPSLPALEAIGVSKRYGRTGSWALLDADLEVPKGTITALVGPNGAGKSTLIRTWVGFERPSRGRVLVGGIDPQEDRAGAVARIGYVSQSTALYRGLTVGEHITLAGTLRPGFDDGAAQGRIEELAIPLSQKAGSLSGGQAAQVALCIALSTGAPVLLLDEPLAALDPLARHDFLNLLVSAVREKGATALLSSHIVSDVEAVCDQLVVLALGRVALQAPIGEAIAEHRLGTVGSVPPEQTVATFARPGGKPTALIRSSDESLPQPSLEELVMGYLAAARAGAASSDRRAA